MLRQTHFVPPVLTVIARGHGILDARGVKLETSETRGSEQQLQQLLAAEVDVAVTAIDNLFIWNQRGADSVLIAQMERTTPLAVFARPGIDELAQLDGRVFGVDAAANGFGLAARFVLERARIRVRVTEVGGVRERWEALRAGEVDATLLGPPFDSFAEKDGLVRVASIGDLISGYPGQGLVASRRALAEKSDEVREYVNALVDAAALANDMDEAVGVALLEKLGFPPTAAHTLWQERARTISVDLAGVEVVASVRRTLGEMPEGADDMTRIFDRRVMNGLS